MKKAYRKRYDFGDGEKYRAFLKKHLLKLNPRYYSVAYFRLVKTTDGHMYAVKIVTEIEDPSMEPIAECWINNQYIYLWRDNCWAVASNEKGEPILKEDQPCGFPTQVGNLNVAPSSCNKIMVIHTIGNDPIE